MEVISKRLNTGGGCKGSKVDGVREPRVLRSPEYASGGARTGLGARERASTPARAATGETPCRVDSGLRKCDGTIF